MCFATSLMDAPSRTLSAEEAESQGFTSEGSVTVAAAAADRAPIGWVMPTASCETSIGATTASAAAVGPRSAERDTNSRGLRRGFGGITDPRLPRSSMRVRCNAASKLNQR